MTLADGEKEYTRVLTLTLLQSFDGIDNNTDLFIPRENPIRIALNTKYHFEIDNYINQNIGATFDKVELLEMDDFAEVLDDSVIVI